MYPTTPHALSTRIIHNNYQDLLYNGEKRQKWREATKKDRIVANQATQTTKGLGIRAVQQLYNVDFSTLARR